MGAVLESLQILPGSFLGKLWFLRNRVLGRYRNFYHLLPPTCLNVNTDFTRVDLENQAHFPVSEGSL